MGSEIISKDLKYFWHPCSQMKDYEIFPPITVEKARGSYLYTTDGEKIMDAISSWWCKSLGHSHPRIKKAVKRQIDNFEHIISANTCNRTLSELSERLCNICPGLDKVFYADNGSAAVEIALKMSLQYHKNMRNQRKTKFASFKNGYHGETILALSAGDCGIYSEPFRPIMTEFAKIAGIPYVSGKGDPKWNSMPELMWKKTEKQLDKLKDKLSAIIFEPIVQGAGGMKIYSPELLKKLRKWTIENNVHLIADEIMTGFGRTGKMLACEHAGITPDLACLSKGLTAGWAPMSAVLCGTPFYNAFYGDYSEGRAFLHSSTYCGYAIGAAAALETLKIFEEEKICEQVEKRSCEIRRILENVAAETGALRNIRSLGFIAAADIVDPQSGKPFEKDKRAGFEFFRIAMKNGAFLRPLGDTVYILPPLNTPPKVLDELSNIIIKSMKSL